MAMASLDSAVEELDERLNRRDNSNADDDDRESVGGDGSDEVEDSQHKGNDAYFMGDANDVFFGTGGGEDDCEAMSPEEEAMQLSELEETYTEPLLCVTDETAKILLDESDKDGSVNDENSNNDMGEDTRSDSSDDSEEDEEEFEQQQIQQFLTSFNMEAHSQEIMALLHPLVPVSSNEQSSNEILRNASLTPLQKHYQQLVPSTISNVDFWTRYYYRCNPQHISNQRQHHHHVMQMHKLKQQQKRERALREVSDAALHIGRSAASFLKGGLSAVAGVGEAVEEAAMGLRMHQGKGRPPFVMNALEDDDDEYVEGDAEDDEEVSLGWGSSDSEGGNEVSVEEGGSNYGSDDGSHEELEFTAGDCKSPVPPTPLKLESLDVVKLRRNLMHAEGERNNMMQMVEERHEEICTLRWTLEQKQCNNDKGGNSEGDDLRREIEWLNNLMAARNVNDATQQDDSRKALKSMVEQMKCDVELACAKATVQELKMKIELLNERNKQRHLEEQINQRKEKVEQLQNEAKETNERISQVKSDCKELQKQQQRQAEDRAEQLKRAVAQVRGSEASTPSHSPPSSLSHTSETTDSMSTGVKVSDDVVDEWSSHE